MTPCRLLTNFDAQSASTQIDRKLESSVAKPEGVIHTRRLSRPARTAGQPVIDSLAEGRIAPIFAGFILGLA